MIYKIGDIRRKMEIVRIAKPLLKLYDSKQTTPEQTKQLFDLQRELIEIDGRLKDGRIY